MVMVVHTCIVATGVLLIGSVNQCIHHHWIQLAHGAAKINNL
eukprot:SAG31_NODE_40927_length_278_cov_0.871508_1_plen_41_part_01